jgi:hypothetical protein
MAPPYTSVLKKKESQSLRLFLLSDAGLDYRDLGVVSSLFAPAPVDDPPEPIVWALEFMCLAWCVFLWLIAWRFFGRLVGVAESSFSKLAPGFDVVAV